MISSGKVFTNDANVAPAPSNTKIAGSAQHSKVDDETNNVNIPSLCDPCFCIMFIISLARSQQLSAHCLEIY